MNFPNTSHYDTEFLSTVRNFMNSEQNQTDDECVDEVYCPEYESNKWMYWTILYYGSSCSVVSLAENVIIVGRLFSQFDVFDSQYVILLLLAVADSITSILYIPVIVVDLFTDRNPDVEWMDQLWHKYVISTLSISQVSLTSGCMLITLLQFERYRMFVMGKASLPRYVRLSLCTLVLALATFLKAPYLLELQVYEHSDCNKTVQIVGLSALILEHPFYRYYSFYIRNCMSVLLPFFLLAYFNISILLHFKRIGRRANVFSMVGTQDKQFTRSATYTFVLIASTYLASNVVNVVITGWEFFDSESLQNDYCNFWQISTDLVSLFTLTCCALRLPIYLVTNRNLRSIVLGTRNAEEENHTALSTIRRGKMSVICTNGIDRVVIAIAVQLHAHHGIGHKLSVATGPARVPIAHKQLARSKSSEPMSMKKVKSLQTGRRRQKHRSLRPNVSESIGFNATDNYSADDLAAYLNNSDAHMEQVGVLMQLLPQHDYNHSSTHHHHHHTSNSYDH